MMKDKHVIEALGKAKVTIEDGKVTSVSEPIVKYCPIFNKYHNIKELTPESIQKNIEYRIDDFGMCTPQRKLKMDDMLSVGVSEILRTNVYKGNIDCVVGVCDGAGTVIMNDPDIIQGVGGRVSGLVSTTPIPEVINGLGRENVLDPDFASIDPLAGIKKAMEEGYKNIAVTLLPSPLVKEIREITKDFDINLYIFVAHTTDTSEKLAKELFENADIVTECASKYIRELAEKEKPYYYGTAVPIYAVSNIGKKFLDTRLEYINKGKSSKDYPQSTKDIPNPLI